MAQKFAIAVGDQRKANLDEVDRFGSQRRGAPVLFPRHAESAVQCLCDVAIRCAFSMCIGRSDRSLDTTALKRREACVGHVSPPAGELQAQKGLDTIAYVCGDRDKRRLGLIERSIG
nr:hypothetical protein [Aureimonas ureilytica]